MRSIKKIQEAETEFYDRVWYGRHEVLEKMVKDGKMINDDIWKGALKAAQEMIKKYSRKELEHCNDFEWGMINGKLSALRWVLGSDWDMLDT